MSNEDLTTAIEDAAHADLYMYNQSINELRCPEAMVS